jgi:hypothetical protein
VNDTLLLKYLVAFNYSDHDIRHACLMDSMLIGQPGAQVTSLAVIRHQVGVVLCLQDLVQFDDIDVVQRLQALDFRSQQSVVQRCFQELHFNHFYCHHFPGLVVTTLKDLATEPFADLVAHAVREFLNGFAGVGGGLRDHML